MFTTRKRRILCINSSLYFCERECTGGCTDSESWVPLIPVGSAHNISNTRPSLNSDPWCTWNPGRVRISTLFRIAGTCENPMDFPVPLLPARCGSWIVQRRKSDWQFAQKRLAVGIAMSRCSENIDRHKDTESADTMTHQYSPYTESHKCWYFLHSSCYRSRTMQYARREQVKMGLRMKLKPRLHILGMIS